MNFYFNQRPFPILGYRCLIRATFQDLKGGLLSWIFDQTLQVIWMEKSFNFPWSILYNPRSQVWDQNWKYPIFSTTHHIVKYEFKYEIDCDFELGRWYGPFAFRDLWQNLNLIHEKLLFRNKKKRSNYKTDDHVHHHHSQDKGEKWWSYGKVLVLFPTLPLSDFHSSFFSTLAAIIIFIITNI